MSTATPAAEVGVFGGSGFSSFAPDAERRVLDTPFGQPSAPVTLTTVGATRVAFIPRHGRRHELPPHRVNFRANVWAMHALGVSALVAPCAAGSLRADIAPGHFVVPDQLVDRTRARNDTFYDGPTVHHVSLADPYCPALSSMAAASARRAGVTVHEGATVVVVQGPRFSTRAESRWFRSQGWDLVNMTQYPEAVLARELGICYVAIALVTDYDAGLEGEVEPVTQDQVFAFLEHNVAQVRAVLDDLLPTIPAARQCRCAAAAGPPVG